MNFKNDKFSDELDHRKVPELTVDEVPFLVDSAVLIFRRYDH